jgi:Na+/H+ antiporter NhaD/arsenite permease-like protein
MTIIFFATWFAQSLTDRTVYNADQPEHGAAAVSWTGYVTTPDFWEKTLQNWQSEFLAIGTMAIFTVYLRQRGSQESKPVGAPHDQTGTSG